MWNVKGICRDLNLDSARYLLERDKENTRHVNQSTRCLGPESNLACF